MSAADDRDSSGGSGRPGDERFHVVPGAVVAIGTLALIGFVIGAMVGLGLAARSDDDGETASVSESDESDESDEGGEEASGGIELIGGEFFFDPDVVESGPTVEITLVNEGTVIHNVEIEGVDGFLAEADPGESASASTDLDPGSYTLFCSIPGHRDAGMVGELQVS